MNFVSARAQLQPNAVFRAYSDNCWSQSAYNRNYGVFHDVDYWISMIKILFEIQFEIDKETNTTISMKAIPRYRFQSLYVASLGCVINMTRGNVYTQVYSRIGKMDPTVDMVPGVKEAAKAYLVAKQIPQLFQVGKLPNNLRDLALLTGFSHVQILRRWIARFCTLSLFCCRV